MDRRKKGCECKGKSGEVRNDFNEMLRHWVISSDFSGVRSPSLEWQDA